MLLANGSLKIIISINKKIKVMKMDYTHYEEDKQTAKQMAREMVGDGQTPNLWFVTYGPYVMVDSDDYEQDFELLDGFGAKKDTETFGPFTSYEDALDKYNDIDLDEEYGIGQVFIEDRHCGTVTEKFLRKQITSVYTQDEHDDSKLFYGKNK